MRMPSLALFLFLLLPPALPADDNNPELNGKTLSQWTTMARENENVRLRRVATSSLGQIGLDALPRVRKEVCITLGKVFRSDSTGIVRAEAAKALGNMSSELQKDTQGDTGSVVIDLAEGLRVEKDTDAKREAALALGRYGSGAKVAVNQVAALLDDKDAAVKENAAITLGRIGAEGKIAVEALLKLLADKELTVRKAATFALGRVEPDDKAKPSLALAALLGTEKAPELRYEVVVSLALLKEKNADVVKALASTLKESSVDIRRHAAKSLALFEEAAKDAQKPLADAFNTDADKQVRAYSARSLCASLLDVDKLVPILVARLDPKVEKESEVRIAICDELGALGPDAQAAVPKIRETQKDPEVRVRDAATAALKKLIAKKP